jgi:hypothetical protein
MIFLATQFHCLELPHKWKIFMFLLKITNKGVDCKIFHAFIQKLGPPLRERPHNTYAFRRFVTKPCKHIGICTVLRYEGGGGQKSRKIALRIMWTFPKWSVHIPALWSNPSSQNWSPKLKSVSNYPFLRYFTSDWLIFEKSNNWCDYWLMQYCIDIYYISLWIF